MEKIDIPGWGAIEPRTLVLDLNGTLTESGNFIPGVLNHLQAFINKGFSIFVLSGDTRGTLRLALENTPEVETVVCATAQEKRAFVESIAPDQVVCIGNGNIDIEMFKAAKLSICTIQAEGAATGAILEADIVVTHINHAFEILLDKEKLIATLRS